MPASYDLKAAVPGTDVPGAGRPAVSRLVLGSVADQVMHKASCPVLTVHPKRK
jgi:nucleotide-binding universal stress UspA family protein